ncbi:MAG: hypothetical protein CMG66_00755 [Candidatus Marinimicrobia bacterium]|nr:hypothetical protein [Candidatus Neomarinimicrobiota bacterium]|tara:strand:+ start:1535 stop:2230 length:696 start_codon:yes stop_codon:yes gene_type:complete
MNLFDKDLIITLILLFSTNALGYMYSYLIASKKIGVNMQIQPNSNRELKYLRKHTPLFIINVFTLMFFVFIGFLFFKDFIIKPQADFYFTQISFQLFIILIFDDTFFYFLHRLMHENKYIYSKVHKIHHRANSPIPIDYIYVHPLEWMSGFIGPFIGILCMGGVSLYTFWMYLFIRNFHEIAIHSGLKTSNLFSLIPFYGTNEHHDVHHAKREGNYSSTFTVWDYILKTKI